MDGELEELSCRVTRDVEVQPIDTRSTDGMRIYQRSMLFVLVVAVRELYPEAQVIVDHSVTLGGFFCQVLGRERFAPQELATIVVRMREIIAAREPIEKMHVATAEASRLFGVQGYDDKVRLLAYRQEPEINVYRLRGVLDYFYGYMLPDTGALNGFDLVDHAPGMILRLAGDNHLLPLHSHDAYPKLMSVFREYGEWLRIMGIEDVGSLNQAVDANGLRREALVSEALHEKRLAEIADEITDRA